MEKIQKKKPFISPRPLFYGFLSLFLAMSTARQVFSGDAEYIALDVCVCVALVVGCVFFKSWKSLLLFLSIFLFGFGWFFVGYSTFTGKTYSGTVSISGRISDNVEYSTYKTSVEVVLKDVKVDSLSESNILLTITLDGTSIEIGDEISFEAELENVKLFTLGSFNSTYYRERTPYVATVSSEDLTISGNHTTLAEKFRLKVKEVLNENMSTETATTAYAVLFGNKNELDSDVKEAYSSAGIVHLLSVSGLHVSFLIALFGFILKKCHVKGWWNTFACAIFAFVYAYLCGFTPSVLRAGIMGVLLFSTAVSGRRYDLLSSLGGAGLIILVLMPLSALDVGFQLSFFCVLSTVIISPWMTKLLKKIFPEKIAQAISLTLSATLGTAPFIAQIYGTTNFLGFFTNLIVLPVFSVLFPLLFVSTLIVMCLPFMWWILKVSQWGFELIYQTALFMGQTKLQASFAQMDIFANMFLYLGLFAMSKYLLINENAKILLCSVLFSLSFFFGVVMSNQKVDNQGISYLYYYSQSVVLLTNSYNETVMVDLASSSFTKNAVETLGHSKISVLFLLQNTSLNTELAQDLGVDSVIRADGGEGYENELLFWFDLEGSAGHFSFAYRGYGTRLLGLEIAYDNMTVFILKDRTASSDALNSLRSDYDVVLLGKQTQYAEHFSGKILSYYSNENSFASYQDDGNIQITNDFKRRCLD